MQSTISRSAMLLRGVIAVCLSATAQAPAGQPEGDVVNDHRKTVVSKGTFEDVRELLELAITERGIVINNVSHIGNMLARTGKDTGATMEVYERAEAIEFCSAVISRAMMEADRHNIVFCPYIISVYTLPGEKDRVYLSYRRPQLVGDEASRKALQDVERLLDEIISESVEH
jgi:uncharacterized protein (DUF302 family)